MTSANWSAAWSPEPTLTMVERRSKSRWNGNTVHPPCNIVKAIVDIRLYPRHSLYDGLVWSLSPPSSKDTTQAAGALACTRRCCDVTRCNGIERRSKSRWNGNSSRKKSASNDDRLSGSLDPETPGHQIRMDYSVRIFQQLEAYYIAGTVSARSLGRREQRLAFLLIC